MSMDRVIKPIRLSEHALGYITKRGFSVEEVREAIQTEPWEPSERGGNRMQCSKEFIFEGIWNRRHYKTKKVRPIFVDKGFEILVITVYTYFY